MRLIIEGVGGYGRRGRGAAERGQDGGVEKLGGQQKRRRCKRETKERKRKAKENEKV